MIEITFRLLCDQCKDEFYATGHANNTVMRRDLERLRSNAMGNFGWRRFRISNTSSNGDYCPDCVKAIAAAKPSNHPKKPARRDS